MGQSEIRSKNISLVLDTAIDLFKVQGVEKTSIEDISVVCGLTPRSIYRYFATRDDLVLAAVARYWKRLYGGAHALLAPVARSNASGIEMVRAMLTQAGIFYSSRYPDIMLIQEMQSFLYRKNFGIHNVLKEMGGELLNDAPTVAAIRKGQADGTIRKDRDPIYLRNMTQNMTLGLMQKLSTVAIKKEMIAELKPEQQYADLSEMIVEFLKPRRG